MTRDLGTEGEPSAPTAWRTPAFSRTALASDS